MPSRRAITSGTECDPVLAWRRLAWNSGPHRSDAIEKQGGGLARRLPPRAKTARAEESPLTLGALPNVTNLLVEHGLIILFAVVAIESLGVPVPGGDRIDRRSDPGGGGPLLTRLRDRGGCARGDDRRQHRLLDRRREGGRALLQRAPDSQLLSDRTLLSGQRNAASPATEPKPCSWVASSSGPRESPRPGSPGSATCRGGAS